MKRISTAATLAIVLATGVVFADTASADPGHVTVRCNSTPYSSGWMKIATTNHVYGLICITLKHHGDHVAISYGVHDSSKDGWDINGYRDLSRTGDGYAYVISADGSGTTRYSNKRYSYPSSGLRWAQLRGVASKDGNSLSAYTTRVYW